MEQDIEILIRKRIYAAPVIDEYYDIHCQQNINVIFISGRFIKKINKKRIYMTIYTRE